MTAIISIVVCTYNRSDMLKGCLDSLCRQTLDESKYEVIVVDNNSSDGTRQLVESFSDNNRIRYIIEPQSGLSHARNRGIQEARGEYVAYIDDDARAAQNWLEIAFRLLASTKDGIDCLGGPCHPFYTSTKPNWFLDKYESRGFEGGPRYLERGEYISGSNMIWRKDILQAIGGFNVKTGVIRNQLRLGEETKAIDHLWQIRQQARIYYSPDMIIYHWVPEFKMHVSYRLKRRFAEGQFRAIQTGLENKPGRLASIGVSLLSTAKATIRFLWTIRSYPHWQNWLAEEGGRIARHGGKLLGLIGIYFSIKQG